jgi:hypothetical protein
MSINTKKVDAFLNAMRKGFVGSAAAGFGGPIGRAIKQWGVRYLTETKRRFVKNSGGGGEWPGLKKITKRRATGTRRRKVDSKERKAAEKKVKILRDTGTLFRALSIGNPGNLFKRIRGGVRVGFGGPSKHPDGEATIRDIAVFHDEGKGDLPKRQILHKPTPEFVKMMRKTLGKAIEDTAKGLI